MRNAKSYDKSKHTHKKTKQEEANRRMMEPLTNPFCIVPRINDVAVVSCTKSDLVMVLGLLVNFYSGKPRNAHICSCVHHFLDSI